MTDSNVPGRTGETEPTEAGPDRARRNGAEAGPDGARRNRIEAGLGRARTGGVGTGTVVESAPAERTEPVGLSTDLSVTDGVALVTCRIRNRTPVPRGVRVIDTLDGPTLPPRSNGVPEVGWDGSTYETVVPAGETEPVGYACPLGDDSEPTEEPAELDAVGPPSLVEEADAETEELVARARRLGDGRPPRDAIPTAESAVVEPSGSNEIETGADSDSHDNDGADSDSHDNDSADSHDHTATAQRPRTDGICPVPVESYFDRSAARIRRAEGTTDGSVESVAAAFRQSHHTPVTLEQAVARDEAALRAIAERASELADRAAETDVPVDALRGLV